MKEVLNDIERWRAAGEKVAIARVVGTEGSSPRDPGATMAVSERGEVAGSVSGGCVEGAVVTEALKVLAGERERGVITFGYSDDEAFAVGLTCGGTIHLFIEPIEWTALDDDLVAGLRADRAQALATVIEGPGIGSRLLLTQSSASSQGTLGNDELDRVVGRDARGELESGTTTVRHYGPCGEAREESVSVFIESFVPAPHMLVFGAVDFTGALVKVAKILGYRVTVCDAREVFATARRFPEADEVVVDWPHRLLEREGPTLGPRDAVCVLTHDHKFDIPAIVAALATDVGYLGAMGSRRTHAERSERLRAEGVDDAGIDRIMAPIGLDLGGRTPEETAISICAEII